MKLQEFAGKVQTVLGLIEPDCLGVTLPHEHILMSYHQSFTRPSEASGMEMSDQKISLENLNWVRHHFLQNLHNLLLGDEKIMSDEVMFFKKAGGSSIVELSCTPSLGRDPSGLARISRATGVNIIMGSGFYESWTGYEKSFVANKTEQELTDHIVQEITEGIGNTGICAGIIGEIGMYWPFSDIQKKILYAVANAQKLTGAALNIHLPLGASSVLPRQKDHAEVAMKVVKTLGDAGANLNRTILSHVDVCCFTSEFRKELAETGCYLGFDSFGIESYSVPIWGTPNDWQRVEQIYQLIQEGHLNQILVSNDTCMKHMCRTYGGWGYAHILTSVVPMMKIQGIIDEQINTIMSENPKRVLAFAPAKK